MASIIQCVYYFRSAYKFLASNHRSLPAISMHFILKLTVMVFVN